MKTNNSPFLLFLYLISIVNILVTALPVSADDTESPQWVEDAQTIVWQDDFEDGLPLNEKYEDVSTNGMFPSTNDAFYSNHSLEQRYDPGQVNAGWIIKVENNGFPDHIYMRWYHKFESSFDSFPPKMARIRSRNRTAWVTNYAVHCWIEAGEIVADVYAPNSSQANSSGWLPLARSGFFLNTSDNKGRWICFEMEVKVNTPGESDGLYRFWADNEMIVERTNIDLRGSTSDNMNEMMLDCYWNGGSPTSQSRFYDDFVIATNRIGPKVRFPEEFGRDHCNGQCVYDLDHDGDVDGYDLLLFSNP